MADLSLRLTKNSTERAQLKRVYDETLVQRENVRRELEQLQEER
jgi:hypothetical protein